MSSQGPSRSLRVLLFVLTVFFVCSFAVAQAKPAAKATAKKTDALAKFKSIERPLTFEENQGQFDGKALFMSRGSGFELMLSRDRARVTVSKPVSAYDDRGHRVVHAGEAGSVQVTLENSNPKAVLAGEGKLAAKSNYYLGTDRSQWREGVPNYSRVRYSSIYPGIDLVYYGNQQQLEHDFIVAPGADPSRIRLGLSGAKSIRLDSNGDLVMEVGSGEVRLLKPVVYQQVGATRQMIAGSYKLAAGKTASFALGSYDKRRALIIDPVLSYSTFLGGSMSDYGVGVAVNGSTVYVAGFTNSSDFIGASNGYQCCSFVAAFDLSSGLVYSTYFGAPLSSDSGKTIAVDPSGNAYITGSTGGGLPVVGTLGSVTYQGGQNDAFVAKLGPSGTLLKSYYVGGLANDTASAIAYDPINSRVVISGTTQSTNFPVASSLVPLVPGQLYKSANAGSSWSRTSGSGSNALGAMDVQTMLIIPGALSPSTYYVGGSAGVYISTDGVNWSAFNNGLYDVPVYSLAHDPSSGALYAGTRFGVYRYTAEQGYWAYLEGGPSSTVTAVLLNPSTPTTVYAADSVRGFFVSTDGGATWSNNNNGLPTSGGNVSSLSLAVASNGTLYATAQNYNSSTGPVFFTSTDAVNWTTTAATGFPSYVYSSGYSNDLFVDSATNKLYAISRYAVRAYVSSDGGNSWSQLGLPGSGLYNYQLNVIVPDPLTPGVLYAGTDQGLFKSTDSGSTWSEVDSGFTSQSIVALAIDTAATTSSGQTVLYAGAMANQAFVMSMDTSLNTVFSTVYGGDGISPNVHPSGSSAYSVATDSQGSIYVTGSTYASAATLPGASNGVQPTPLGDRDAYLLKLTSGGTAAWSTFVGGSSFDDGQAVAVGADGGIVVYGKTGSSDLPVSAGTYQTSCSNCFGGFFAKYSATGSKIFTTYFAPQNNSHSPQAMALDASSNIYFTAFLFASKGAGAVPLVNPLDQSFSNLTEGSYLGELSADGSKLLFSTALGGGVNTYTYAYGVATDAAGAAYVTGYTNAIDFPIAGNPIQSSLNGGASNSYSDAFLMQITRTGASNDVALTNFTPTTMSAMAGDPVTFNFTIQNLTATGNGASNVVLETDLPLSGISIPGAECSLGTRSRCYLGTLAPGASVSGSASTTYPSAGTFSNIFTVRTDDDDPVPSNNNAVIAATIAAASQPDLAVTVTPDRNPAGYAELVNFTVTVKNKGLGMATGINLSSTISGTSVGPFYTIGSQWLHLMPAGTAPNAREDMPAVYDPNTNSMIVFGGYDDVLGTGVDDVWVLSNANGVGLQTWTKLSPIGTPPDPRYDHTAVYNPSTNRMIVFGGYSQKTGNDYNDVWVLTHANGQGGPPQWIQLAPSGSLPPVRDSHVATYDVASNTMTIVSGYTNEPSSCGVGNDVWTLTNADGSNGTPNWAQLTPSGSGPAVEYGTAVYDPASNRIMMFGGYADNGGTCSETNSLWILTNANGQGGTPAWIRPPLGSESAPAPRDGHVAAYDSASNSMLVYGGYVPNYAGDTDEVWRLSNANAITGDPTWNKLAAPSNAGPREYGAGGFDPSTRSFTVFGGYNSQIGDINDVFTLKGWDSTCSQPDYYTVSCQLGNLPPGQSTTAVLQVQADAIPPADDTLTSTATEDQTDANPADNTGSATIHVDYADLGVTMNGPLTAAHSANFDYDVVVTNYGPGPSQPTTLQVPLDANLTYYSASSDCYNDGGVFCNIPSLAPGASEIETITVTAPDSTGSVTSRAILYYYGNGIYGNDSHATNDATGNVVTTIAGSAALSGYLYGDYSAVVGAPVPLTAYISNDGPDGASNVTLTLTLPPQLSLGYGATGCSGTTGTITCTIGPITSGQTVSNLRLPVVANYPGAYTILANLQDSGSANPYPPNNAFSYTVIASPLSVSGVESFVVSLTDRGQVAAYYFSDNSPHDSAQSGAAPGSSVIDPSGRYMYVKSGGFEAYTSVVDFTVKDEVSRVRGVNGRPVLLTPDGTRLISRLASPTTDALAIVDTSTQQIVKTISLDGLIGDATGVADIAITSGVITRNKAYLQVKANKGGIYSTLVVDLASFSVKEVTGSDVHLPLVEYPRSIAAKSDGTTVYALRDNPPEMLVIDTGTDSVRTTVPLTQLSTATAIAVTRDPNDTQGQYAYIAGASEGYGIITMDLSANSFTEWSTGTLFLPTDLLLSADGTSLEAFHLGVADTEVGNAGNWPTPSLYCDCSPEFTIGSYLGGVASGFVYSNNDDSQIGNSSLVSISDVQPASIDNSSANKLSILGSNFASNSKVRIGKLDPVAATFVSSGRLDVTLPALVPEQQANVVVTLPNLQEIPTGRNVSTIWETGSYNHPVLQRLNITSNFTLPNPLAILRYGDSTLDLVDTSKAGKNLATIGQPNSLAFSPDGQTAYVSSGAQATGVQAISLVTGTRTIVSPPVPTDSVGYQDALGTGIDPVDGKPVLYFNSGDGETTSNRLSIVDADSNSPTFNQFKRGISANDRLYAQGSGALAVSPDGQYVYTFADVYDSAGFLRTDLIGYDVANNTAAIVHDVYNSWGAEQNVPNHLRVSPDGNWLIMAGAAGGVEAVDIGGDRSLTTTPTHVVTLNDGTHSFKTFQVFGNRLFAFDANTNTVTAFNFLPGSSNFSKLGSVTIPGPGSYYESPLLVDPSGTYVYVALKDQDAIAILDANKVAGSDPSALLDLGGDDRGVEALAISPSVSPKVNVSAVFESGTYSGVAGIDTVIYGGVTNIGALAAHQVVARVTPPSGASLVSVTWRSSNDSGSCQIGTTATDCTIPELSGGDSATFTITFIAPTQTPTTFTFAVISTQETNVSQTPPATTTINTTAGGDLSVTSTMTSLTGPFATNDPVSYTVTINNLGPATIAASLSLTTQDLTGVQVSSQAGIGCSVLPDTNFFCSSDSLPPNTPLTITVTGKVPPNKSSIFLVASASGSDPNPSNNDVSATLPVNVTASDVLLVPSTGYGTISAYDPNSLGQPLSFGTGGMVPLTVVPMPNGRTAFLVNLRGNYISVYDLTIQSEIYRIRDIWPLGAVLTSDASQLVVSNHYDTTLSVYDTSTFQLVKQIPVTGLAANTFIASMFVAGNNLYLLSSGPDKIHVVNLTTGAVSAVGTQMTFGSSANQRFAITPDQSTVVAIGGGNASNPGTVFLIDAATATLTQAIALPISNFGGQTSLAVGADTNGSVYAYISMFSNLRVMDLTPASQTYGQFLAAANILLPIAPTSSVITSDGSTVVLGQNGNASIGYNLISASAASIRTGQPGFAGGNASQGVGIISHVVSSLQPPSNAPQISNLSSSAIVNNTATTLQIDGTGFSADAVVKIGSANPLTPSSVAGDGTQLTVTVPANTPSGYSPVIVIDRNAQGALGGRNVASAPSYLYVIDASSLSPQTDVFAMNYGNGTLFAIGPNAQTYYSGASVGVANPWGVALTANNIGFAVSDIDHIVTSTIDYHEVQLSGQTTFGDSIALVPDPNTGRMVALVPSEYNPTTNTFDWQMNVIDADPYSPTADTVLYSIPAGESANSQRSSFAVTPDGKFAFLGVPLSTGGADLVVFDLTQRRVAASIPAATLGIDTLVNSMQVSPDGKYLAVANLASNNVQVLSIASPVNPSSVGSIPILNPNGVAHTHCCNIRIANNQLFVFDPGTMFVSQFNFLPGSANFGSIGKVQLPGSLSPVLQGGMAVSPDGAYLYVAEIDDDAIDVLDTTRIVTSDINQALIARMSSQGTGPASIAVNPVSSAQHFADLSVTLTHSPEPASARGTITYTVTVTNLGPDASANVVFTDSLPSGMTFVSTADASCSGTTVVTCSLGSLSPNQSIQVGLVVSAAGITSAGQYTNKVTAGQSGQNVPDPNSANNTATDVATFVSAVSADLVLAPAGAPVNINGVPTYTVTVTNNGPSAAQNVILTDTLSGFGFVGAVSTVSTCSFNGSAVTCALGNLANGASATVNVGVSAPGNGWALNEFHVTSSTVDPVPTNNSVNLGPFGGSVGNTAAGVNVLVDALDPASGMAANFLFSNIAKPGLTKVTSMAGTQPPAGYRFGNPAIIFDLSTTASYSGPIRVALRLAGFTFHHPNAVRLFHMENGTWVDRTMSLNTAQGMITAMTSSLSPFALVEPLNSIPAANAGTDQTVAGASAGGASLTLNGGTSTDADGDALTYTWTGPFAEGTGTVTGANPKVTLPLGMSKITLVVNDGESNSAPASVNVTVSDFLIAAPAGQIVLGRGQSTSFDVVLTPKYGAFDQPVTVACGKLPAGLTCAVKDNSVTPGSQGTTVTVMLTASSSARLRNNAGPLFAFWLGGVPVFGILLAGKAKRDRRSLIVLLLIVVVLIVGMVACGGAGSNSVAPPPSSPSGTTTTITITGTSGDLQHSSTAAVTIQ